MADIPASQRRKLEELKKRLEKEGAERAKALEEERLERLRRLGIRVVATKDGALTPRAEDGAP